MERDDRVLLLTASINPAASNTPLTVLTDPRVRWQHYEANLMAILKLKVFGKIIFCENTNYQGDYSAWHMAAENTGTELEVILFEGTKSCIEKQGKGYGEGEIIEYAIRHSKWLNPRITFYKLTGRIQVKNLIDIVMKHDSDEVLFIRAQRKKEIADTRLFKCSVNFYNHYLAGAHKDVSDLTGLYLEKVYFQRLKKAGNIKSFHLFPRFSGVSGSTNEVYDLPLKEYLKYSLLLKLGLLNI